MSKLIMSIWASFTSVSRTLRLTWSKNGQRSYLRRGKRNSDLFDERFESFSFQIVSFNLIKFIFKAPISD
jgi:hypothetical protein